MEKQANMPKLRFPEFEKDWVRTDLGAVLNITSSSRVHKDEWTEKGVPFFRSSDVVADFKGDKNTKVYISFELYNSLSDKIGRVKKDDILITGGGSIGIPFLIKNNDPLYFKDADLLWIKNDNKINGYFLYSFFLTQSFREYLKSVSHVGTIAHYTVVQAKNTTFHFPILPEQQKIASFLTAVDEKFQALKKKRNLLDQYKKGLMQKIFSQELRFKADDGSEFPEWEEKKFLSYIKLYRGSSPRPINKYITKSEDGVNWIKIGDMKSVENNLIDKVSEKITAEGALHSRKVEIGELILANSMSFGKTYQLNISGCIYDGWFVLREYEKYFSKEFLLQLLNSEYLQKQYETLSTGGVVQNISSEIVYSTNLLKPSLQEQTKIANFLSAIDAKIHHVQVQIEKMEMWKKGLLQKMFV